jgi:hypothetical protein
MVERAHRQIRQRMDAGATLDEIETLIRVTPGVNDEERAALWLYAWHYAPAPDTADPYHDQLRRGSLEPAPQPLG